MPFLRVQRCRQESSTTNIFPKCFEVVAQITGPHRQRREPQYPRVGNAHCIVTRNNLFQGPAPLPNLSKPGISNSLSILDLGQKPGYDPGIFTYLGELWMLVFVPRINDTVAVHPIQRLPALFQSGIESAPKATRNMLNRDHRRRYTRSCVSESSEGKGWRYKKS